MPSVTDAASRLPDGETAFAAALDRWSALILERGYVEEWVEGAIFPSEMSFFLAACETEGISRVIESGRQDGYSTRILGEYALETKAEVVSIDLEMEPERAARCRQRLARFPVRLARGSAYELVGRYSREPAEKTALIVDGPKGWPALSLIFAAASSPSVALVSLHNLAVGLDTREFVSALGGKVFHEDLVGAPGTGGWAALRAREHEFCSAAGARRDLDASSLGIVKVTPEVRRRMAGCWDARFGLHQPAFVRALWSLGLYAPSTKLYGLSYRLLKR